MTFGLGWSRVRRLRLRRHTFSNDAAAAHDLFWLSYCIELHRSHLDGLSNDVSDALQIFILAELEGFVYARVGDSHVRNFAFCRGLSSYGHVRRIDRVELRTNIGASHSSGVAERVYCELPDLVIN